MLLIAFAPLASYGPNFEDAPSNVRKQLKEGDPEIIVKASDIDFHMNYVKEIHKSKKEYEDGMVKVNEELDTTVDERGTGVLFDLGLVGCLVLAISMLALVFLFKKRKAQIRLGIALFIITLVLTTGVFIASQVALRVFAELDIIPLRVAESDWQIGYGYGFFLLPVVAILLLVGVIFVRRDDNLVKSLDRLR
jgi:hypothetical protein